MSDQNVVPPTDATVTGRRAFLGGAASLGLGLLGTGRPARAQTPPARTGRAKILKFGSLGTDIHPATISARFFAEQVNKGTNGSIEVQVFPSAQLGGEREASEGMLLGSVQGMPITLAVMGNWVPESQLFELPFLFRDDQHALGVMGGAPGNELAERFPAKGFRVFGYELGGIRHLMAKFPINVPADIKGKKMRTIQSPLHIALWQTLGAIPTPLPPGEIYGAMQTGVIDFFDNAKSSYWDMKWYEVAPYLTELGHIYTFSAFALSERFWKSLSPDEQKVVEAAAKQTIPHHNKLVLEDDVNALRKAVEKGTKVLNPNRKPWQEAMHPIWDQFGGKLGGMPAIQKVVDFKG
jgi:tripartite ATP-independent transporter DctP family solute receptor